MKFVGFLLLGLIAGTFSGLFGVGGGAIIVPALIFLGNIEPHIAIGTSLLIIIPTSIIGTIKHWQLNHINWIIAIFVSIGACFGAWLGSSLTYHIQGATLKRLFGIFLLGIAIKLIFSKN